VLRIRIHWIHMFLGLPDPDPFSEVWIRILPFSHKGVERTEIMLANKILIQYFLAKNLIFIIKHIFTRLII
jgi:hypothetical protein